MNTVTISGFTSKKEYARVNEITRVDEATGEEIKITYVNTTLRHKRRDGEVDVWQVSFSGKSALAFLQAKLYEKLVNISGEIIQEKSTDAEGNKRTFIKIRAKAFTEIKWEKKAEKQNETQAEVPTAKKEDSFMSEEAPKKSIKDAIGDISKEDIMSILAAKFSEG